jgi:hypothetical protein
MNNWLLVTVNVVPSFLILSTLMMEEIHSSKSSGSNKSHTASCSRRWHSSFKKLLYYRTLLFQGNKDKEIKLLYKAFSVATGNYVYIYMFNSADAGCVNVCKCICVNE